MYSFVCYKQVYTQYSKMIVLDGLCRRLRQLADQKRPLTMIVNPQYEGKGNVISDFGIGARKQVRSTSQLGSHSSPATCIISD